MIIPILYLIFFTSVVVLAWRIAISEGMLLEKVSIYAEYKVEKGNKAFELIQCPFCMPTLFTFFGWVFILGLQILPLELNAQYVLIHLIAWFSCCIFCGFTWVAYKAVVAKKDYYETAKKYYENAEKISFFEIKDRKENYRKKIHSSNFKDY